MSITLGAVEQDDLSVNVWNWGVLHHLVAEAGLFPAELWEPMRFNGGGDLAPGQVATLARFLAETVLPRLRAGERMFFDGSVTAVPADGTLFRGETEGWRNYGLRHEVLARVVAFLRAARGSVSVY